MSPRSSVRLAWAGWIFVVASMVVIQLAWGAHNLWTVLFLVAATSIPVATGVAVRRYRLYEIDLIIRKTLVYTALAVTLAVVYLGGISLTTWAFRSVTGQSGALAVTLSTLAVAAAFQPLRTRMRGQVDLDALHTEVLTVVVDTLQPSQASLWRRGSGDKA